MSEGLLTVLKYCFLALLYLFLLRVVRLVVTELRAPASELVVDRPPARPTPPPPSRTRGQPRLQIVEPADRRGETFPLADEVTVGRGGGCGIVLSDDFVSQVHARLYRRDGDVYVEDLGSRNGTYVNGEAVQRATRLRRGDQLQFGQTVAEVVR